MALAATPRLKAAWDPHSMCQKGACTEGRLGAPLTAQAAAQSLLETKGASVGHSAVLGLSGRLGVESLPWSCGTPGGAPAGPRRSMGACSALMGPGGRRPVVHGRNAAPLLLRHCRPPPVASGAKRTCSKSKRPASANPPKGQPAE